ncbi:MAG: YjjG family noncanonical pyrimidine nucleotidase [Clostridia bacterium]|nr:YjjG family noncanonical pyrimidine nucleotidase [Clostridia bacterium]
MKYKTLLFDADGTLLDFERAEYEALSDVLAEFGIPDTKESHCIYSAANDEQWKLLERGLVTRSELRINRFVNFMNKVGVSASAHAMADSYMHALATKSHLLDGALDLCRELSQTHELYIITNGFRYIQQGRFFPSPLAPLFRDIFISEDIGVDKPDAAFFNYVKAHIPNFTAESTLVIGDSLSSDIAGGIRAGLDVCWYNPKGKSTPADMNITYTVSQLSDILPIARK